MASTAYSQSLEAITASKGQSEPTKSGEILFSSKPKKFRGSVGRKIDDHAFLGV